MKVKMSVKEVLAKLKTNRDSHRKAFLDACEGYRDEMIALCNRTIDTLKSGQLIRQQVYKTPPEEHTKDYDHAVTMLNMSVEETIELDEEETAQYIADDWGWKDQWRTVTNSYAKTKV